MGSFGRIVCGRFDMVKWIWEEIYIRNIKSLEVVVVIMVYYSLEYFGLFFLLWK